MHKLPEYILGVCITRYTYNAFNMPKNISVDSIITELQLWNTV